MLSRREQVLAGLLTGLAWAFVVCCGGQRAIGPDPEDAEFYVYRDVGVGSFVPTNWFGTHPDLKLDEACRDQPASAPTCLRVTYEPSLGYAGIYWVNPPNTWGERRGGFDLGRWGARRVTFFARGRGVLKFGVGGIGRAIDGSPPKPFADTFGPVTIGPIHLETAWRRYEIDVTGQDLSRVVGGFFMTIESAKNTAGAQVDLDEIRWER